MALFVSLILSMLGAARPSVSVANFQRLTVGMTQRDVEKLFGRAGEWETRWTGSYFLTWENASISVRLRFSEYSDEGDLTSGTCVDGDGHIYQVTDAPRIAGRASPDELKPLEVEKLYQWLHVLVGLCRNECFYRGFPSHYWRKKVLNGSITPVYWSRDYMKQHAACKEDAFPLSDGDPACIPVLIEILNDKDARVRMYAVQTLGSFGRAAVKALPALERLRNDQEIGAFGTTVGSEAEEALRAIRSAPPADSPADNALRRLSREQTEWGLGYGSR